jgi:hypothetical protein
MMKEQEGEVFSIHRPPFKTVKWDFKLSNNFHSGKPLLTQLTDREAHHKLTMTMFMFVLILAVVISTIPNSQAFTVYRGSLCSTRGSSWIENSLKNIHPSLLRQHVTTEALDDVHDSHPQPSVPQPVNANADLLLARLQQNQDDETPHGSNVITVTVERNLPISAIQAKEAWNKVVWRDSQKRTVWPFWLQEEQQQQHQDHDDDKQQEILKIHSQVVNLGALQWELQLLPEDVPPGSLVSFAPCPIIGGEVSLSGEKSSCCHLTWQVRLAAKHPQVVHAVTSFWMNACVNEWFDATIATPRLLHRQVVIPKVTVDAVVNAWLDFVWIQGGGLPLPFPPMQLPPKSSSGNGTERAELSLSHRSLRRIIVPPGLSESILSTTHHPGDKQGMIRYQVDNPGILTYPVHTHEGLVHFSETTMALEGRDEPSVQLDWFVEIRPFRQMAWFAEAFTESVVKTLSRNLAVHLSSAPFGSGMVQVSPPRGKGKSFASVRKDSWLGGVLEAHLSDHRSTFQQTLSMLQPWTWGRATDESLLKHGLLKAPHTAWSSGNLNQAMTEINSDNDERIFA